MLFLQLPYIVQKFFFLGWIWLSPKTRQPLGLLRSTRSTHKLTTRLLFQRNSRFPNGQAGWKSRDIISLTVKYACLQVQTLQWLRSLCDAGLCNTDLSPYTSHLSESRTQHCCAAYNTFHFMPIPEMSAATMVNVCRVIPAERVPGFES